MVFKENVSLAQYSTMRLGGEARYFCEVTTEAEIEEAVEFALQKNLKIHVVGGGSNTVFSDEGFKGLAVLNKVSGLEVKSSDDSTEMNVGAGEEWDLVVERSVEAGFSDIATLSLIPGSTGGAPVQNIGAYGQQISDSLVSLRAYNVTQQQWEIISKEDCSFGYRRSRFNQKDKGVFIVSSVKLRLSRKSESAPFYKDLEQYFSLHDISTQSVSPQELRKATIAIRQAKLPDPKKVANAGSFFKNPVVDATTYSALTAHYPYLRSHKTDDGKLKLYAGQLIELAGLKNYHDKATGMATWKNQALVLVNEHAGTTADLLAFRQKIISSVHAAFGITLQQEPEFIEG